MNDPASFTVESLPPGPGYKPGELIMKFKKGVADSLEEQLAEGRTIGELNLTASLDSLNRRYKAVNIEPVIKNFKANRKRTQSLLRKDEALLTKRERHLVRRLQRAPEGAKVPDLGRIYIIELAPGQSAAAAVAEYNKSEDVEYAELNCAVSIMINEPNDPNYYPEQWALHNDGSQHPIHYPPCGTASGTAGCDINAPEAWDITTGSSDIVVAVIDTGVDYNHADITDNMWTDANGCHGYDFVNDDNDPMDDLFHGTHCAGIIAAVGNNGLDITGVCWDASIMAVKFLNAEGWGWTADAIEAVYYAVENGADIMSNSWGSGNFSASKREVFDYAYSQGVFSVAAAGNDNNVWPHYPAYCSSVMAVAATDHNDNKASRSCYGDWIDVAAPGVDILSLKASCLVHRMLEPFFYPCYDPNATMLILEGTSMACPHVAGLAALCLAEEPNLTVGDLWVLIKNGAHDLGEPGDDIYFGAGRIDAYTTLNYISDIPEPNKATGPYPTDGATDQSVNVHISWQADSWAASHDVYLGTDFNDVNDANTSSVVFQASQKGTVFDPNTLAPNKTYYWRIDEKNFSATTKGDVWNFTTGSAGVIYVDTDASGANDGTSWSDAFNDLHDALDKAFDGDQIWVAEGTYKPDGNDPNIGFEMREGVALCGGFDANETDPNQRDPNLNENLTILSGDIGTVGDANDNSYHVLFLIGNHDSNTLVDRFKIVDGNACGTLGKAYGGGIFNYNCQVRIKDCIFTDNYGVYGGGISSNGLAGTITNCTFNNNKAYCGGGILSFLSSDTGFSIGNCRFDKNTAPYRGGAIYSTGDGATITDCNFTHNSSEVGAIFASSSDLFISSSTFDDNKGSMSSGGIYTELCSQTTTNCTFKNNSGAIYLQVAYDTVVNNCAFEQNDRGGITVSSPRNAITIKNCTFRENNGFGVKTSGGLIWPVAISNSLFFKNVNTNVSLQNAGGGICAYNSYPKITNCTFAENSAVYGGAICNYNTSEYCEISIEITNCILWDNTATTSGNEIYNGVSDPNIPICYPQISYSDIEGCGAPDNWDPNFGTNVGWNMDTDPCFVDSDANNFHLDPNSLCIDAGDPNRDYTGQTDIDGEPRVMGDCNEIVDMGADEVYFPNCWNCDTQCHGDSDCDGQVNTTDFFALRDSWFKSYPDPNYNPCADFNRDGSVNTTDFFILRDYWFEYPDPNCICCGEDPNCTWPPDQGEGGRGGGEQKSKSQSYTDADIEELIGWLDELWLTNEEIRKMISEDEWLKFIESVVNSK